MQITTAQLNQVAELIGATDKNMVFSAVLKTLVECGISTDAAFDCLFGDGAFKQFAGNVYDVYAQNKKEGRKARAHAEMLAALQVTLGNIMSLGPAGALESVPMPYRVWADVVKSAIDKAKST